MPRVIALLLLTVSCARPHAERDAPVSRSPAPEPEVATVVVADATASITPVTPRLCAELTRRLPGLAEEGTFMLQREQSVSLDVTPLAQAAPGKQQLAEALEKAIEPWTGRDSLHTAVHERHADGGARRYAFDVAGSGEEFATCHAAREEFVWHVTLDVNSTSVVGFVLTGAGNVVEDICNAKNGGSTRDVVGRWRATYTAKLAACES